MLRKITVQQWGSSNSFGAEESLRSSLLICTSVVTMWQLIFFVLNLSKSPLFPQKVYCDPNYVTDLLLSTAADTQRLSFSLMSLLFHCFCSEAGGGQGISRGCCCSWLTIPLPSSITILTGRARCHLYPWNKIVTQNPSNKMMKVLYKRNSRQWL